MTYKQIEAARELRLWIGQVIVPTVSFGLIAYANPNVREFVSEKTRSVKQKLNRKKEP